MVTRLQTPAGSEQELVVEQKIQQVRELYADAPELGRVALENGLSNFRREPWRHAIPGCLMPGRGREAELPPPSRPVSLIR